MALVAVQLSVLGLYLPPVFEKKAGGWEGTLSRPRRSFQCQSRLQCDGSWASGTLVVLVVVQVSVLGLYLPPVLKKPGGGDPVPPQTIISVPVQTAV